MPLALSANLRFVKEKRSPPPQQKLNRRTKHENEKENTENGVPVKLWRLDQGSETEVFCPLVSSFIHIWWNFLGSLVIEKEKEKNRNEDG